MLAGTAFRSGRTRARQPFTSDGTGRRLRARIRGALLATALAATAIGASAGHTGAATDFQSAIVSATRFFPELAHNVSDVRGTLDSGEPFSAPFLGFFNRNGGVERWGFPTSEPFVERAGTLSQYFQRGVLDFDPAIGIERRLVWDFIGGGLGGSPDLGVEPDILNANPGVELGPWGHRVANLSVEGEFTGFLDAFGRLGGLESLGFPKTDARLDSGEAGALIAPGATAGFIRQYFQAGVMELHRGQPDPVKLRLLGDVVRDRIYIHETLRPLLAFQAAEPLVVGAPVALDLLRGARSADPSVEAVAQHVIPALARVETDVGCASGFFITPVGHLVTNWHVIDDAGLITVIQADGSQRVAVAVAGHVVHDLAILQVADDNGDAVSSTPVEWGRSDELNLGARLAVLGHPATIGGCSERPTVTVGVLSSLTPIEGLAHLQTDSALNPGNSGGPVAALDGTIVGISVSGLPGLQNTNFLIPEARARPLIDAWLAMLAAGESPPLPELPTSTGGGRLRIGEVVNGTLGPSEFALWTFEGASGQYVDIEAVGFDTFAALIGPGGTVLRFNDDGRPDLGSRIRTFLPETGTYTIRISGFLDAPGDYALSVIEALARERGVLALGDEVTGSILNGEVELWRFQAAANQIVQLETAGFDTIMALYGPDLQFITENDDAAEAGPGSAITWRLETAGEYRVEVRGFVDSAGDYTLTPV